MTANCYTFDAQTGALDLELTPVLYGIETMPYRHDWGRWQDHVANCAQCAQYVHELANVTPVFVSSPCPTGTEMIAEYRYSVDAQHIESRLN